MHGSLAANQRLLAAVTAAAGEFAGARCAVCVPFPYLAQAQGALAGSAIALGAQNVSEHDAGAFTGEVAGAMLRDFGCTYAIVGHSERRTLYGERDGQVAEKFLAAQRAGLVPILCVGETLAQRDNAETEAVVARQLDAVIEAAGVRALRDAVVAYEPVWAIGTGENATAEQAGAAHKTIRKWIAGKLGDEAATIIRILYGGSVKPDNCKELMAVEGVDGLLVGGASLHAETFVPIIEYDR